MTANGITAKDQPSQKGVGVAKSKKTKDGAKVKKARKGRSNPLKSLADNPLVADVVAAALVATASALKDSRKARQLAVEAGDDLRKLNKEGAERGSALWEMALEIGRRSLDALAPSELGEKKKAKAKWRKSAPVTAKPKKDSGKRRGERKSAR